MKDERKILIIDDEPDILEFLSYNFRKHNFKVTIASNGLEGIDKIKSERPDVIISDILMPEMDGIEMCRAIRKTEFKDIPFIFLTAVSDDYKVLYAMTSGADQFASKPIRFEYLLKMVTDLLVEEEVK
ncbi:MAG TPA: response regulator [Bacteroidia bacterium]|jgi:two-component system alkaline phosphatase synthesis response regulator PhoP